MQQKIQVQVIKKYKEINEAIIAVIAKTWRKNKVASKLLKIWKITVHLPQ